MQTQIITASVGKNYSPQWKNVTAVNNDMRNKSDYMFTIFNIGKIQIGSCVSIVTLPGRSSHLSSRSSQMVASVILWLFSMMNTECATHDLRRASDEDTPF